MIPDYTTFIRFHDKRMLALLYILLPVMLGFYWRNNGYVLFPADAGIIAALLSITLFNTLFDVKASWAYSSVLRRVDLSCFNGQRCTGVSRFLSRPAVLSIIAFPLFWLLILSMSLWGEDSQRYYWLAALLPLIFYVLYHHVRLVYIRQVIAALPPSGAVKNLYRYLWTPLLLSLLVSLLSVSPLKNDDDFSLSEGYFSGKLMVAMWLLCAAVLGLNLLFNLWSKRYIFLGRIFLREIDFYFSPRIPLSQLQRLPFVARMILLAVLNTGWIILISAILALTGWQVKFELYFLCCYLPAAGYLYLHLYWHWHNEFLLTCDMYFRYEVIKKRQAIPVL
ncbi:hypothetical protein RABR111495_19155 [Rahnella bruchi]|uniref:hypothetical protein n=1 Tax=Rahnella bruchi TaxID=1510573 RepID=UPI000EA018D9|nr:hypothetical protein [Rahnella bruchi]